MAIVAQAILASLFASATAATLVAPARQQHRQPGSVLGAVFLGISGDGERASGEQAAQVAATLLADAAEQWPLIGRARA